MSVVMNHQPANLDLQGAGAVFSDIPFDQFQGFLHRFFSVFGCLINGDVSVMDLADQLADGFTGDPAEHVEDGELDGGQRDADGHPIESEVEFVDEELSQGAGRGRGRPCQGRKA